MIDNSMIDNSMNERRKEIGRRIAKERKKAGLTHDGLADKIKKELGVRPGQSTISMWEHGNSFPENIETIFAMSKIFGCDCGYLLCDYDEKTHDSKEICNATGLSEESVNTLCNLNSWGVETELTSVVDGLIYDLNHSEKENSFTPLVYLIHWFLAYKGNGETAKMVHIDGEIVDCHDADGYIASSIKLNDRIIENAVLTEIQQCLISLKKRTSRKERGKNGKH